MLLCSFLSQQLSTVEKPDSVSIYHVHRLSSVEEGKEFQLRCDIVSIAPAQNVTVLWYKNQGEELFCKYYRRTVRDLQYNTIQCFEIFSSVQQWATPLDAKERLIIERENYATSTSTIYNNDDLNQKDPIWIHQSIRHLASDFLM